MKVVFDENVFDEIDHFHPNFDESVPNRCSCEDWKRLKSKLIGCTNQQLPVTLLEFCDTPCQFISTDVARSVQQHLGNQTEEFPPTHRSLTWLDAFRANATDNPSRNLPRSQWGHDFNMGTRINNSS